MRQGKGLSGAHPSNIKTMLMGLQGHQDEGPPHMRSFKSFECTILTRPQLIRTLLSYSRHFYLHLLTPINLTSSTRFFKRIRVLRLICRNAASGIFPLTLSNIYIAMRIKWLLIYLNVFYNIHKYNQLLHLILLNSMKIYQMWIL